MRRLRLLSLTPILLLLSMVGAPFAIAQSVSIPTQINTQNTTAESTSLTAAALNADLLPATDVSAYRSWSLQVSGTWSATLTLQGSNDNTNWFSLPGWLTNDNTTAARNTMGANGVMTGPVITRYMRVRATAYTSGTANGTAEFYSYSFAPYTIGVGGSVTASVSNGTVNITPTTANGSTLIKFLAAASTNATSVKASAGQLYSYQLTNTAASIRYVHFYNKASAPTVGSDVPVVTVAIPATSSVYWHDGGGTPFNVGIAYSITTGSADTDSTAVSLGDVVGIGTYK